jgi:hypothetical protein
MDQLAPNVNWLVIQDAEDDEDVEQIDVVPGRMIDGKPIHHGHILGPGCDCRPSICPHLSSVVVIHRHIV